MSQTIILCPHLGLNNDSSSRLSYADERHRCFAVSDAPFPPDIDHQLRYCLGAGYSTCSRYRMSQADVPVATPDSAPRSNARRQRSPVRTVLWVSLALVAAIVVWRLIALLATPASPTPAAAPVVIQPTATPTVAGALAMPTPAPNFTAAAESTPVAVSQRLQEELPTPSLAQDEVFVVITPEPDAVGWVASDEARGNHLGDSYLYTGVFAGTLFHGIAQFDLSRIPRGAPIHSVSLAFTGLEDNRLDAQGQATWQVRWLDAVVNEDWQRLTFQGIHNADVFQTILPPVSADELAPYVINEFVFDAAQLSLLQQAILDEQPRVAFRLDGPETGDDNVYSWDSGYGPASKGSAPSLRIITGPPPATPPPVPTREFVVVTSTPTPANVLTAAAIKRTEVAVDLRIGTVTPTPLFLVTATPTAQNEETVQYERLSQGLPFVVTATPRPINRETATANSVYATAMAITTGTWTPLPTDYVTATPTATFVAVTNTPTAANIFELLERVIAEATRTAIAGPPTPLPPGVVTVTPTWTRTPEPLNEETAQAQVVMVTIQAITTGTWTPTPRITGTVTAAVESDETLLASATASEVISTSLPTPTPTITLTPTSTPTATRPAGAATVTATPRPAASSLGATLNSVRGRILFKSDRQGQAQVYAMNPSCIQRTGGCTNADLVPLQDTTGYDLALEQAAFAPNRNGRVIVQNNDNNVPQVYLQDFIYNTIKQVTSFTGASYDPVWSPVGSRVLFVSNESGSDDLYAIGIDGSNVNRLTDTRAWDKHPAWSPDGTQVIFFSNRDGRNQIWIMNADGTNQRKLLASDFNDYDPLWVR